LRNIVADIQTLITCANSIRHLRRAKTSGARGAALHRRNAGLIFDPWIKVWQLVQGVISDDPALIE
jgi:hypothetical protein